MGLTYFSCHFLTLQFSYDHVLLSRPPAHKTYYWLSSGKGGEISPKIQEECDLLCLVTYLNILGLKDQINTKKKSSTLCFKATEAGRNMPLIKSCSLRSCETQLKKYSLWLFKNITSQTPELVYK